MDSCPLPIEVCEAVMGTIPIRELRNAPYAVQLTAQRTLCSCSLVCRAWRIFAQRLLWSYVYIKNPHAASSFISAIRVASEECRSLLSTLHLGEELRSMFVSHEDYETLDMVTAIALFLQRFPRLHTLHCAFVRFNVPARIFRTRLPFFTTLTTLILQTCIFDSARHFLDLVWSCPNLSHLRILGGGFRTRVILSAAEATRLASIRDHLGAGTELVSLSVDAVGSLYGGSAFMLVKRVFGPVLTSLRLTFLTSDEAQCMSRLLLDNSLAALRVLHVQLTMNPKTSGDEWPYRRRPGYCQWEEPGDPRISKTSESLLHMIVSSLAPDSQLEYVWLEGGLPYFHYVPGYLPPARGPKCCRLLVENGEEAGEDRPWRDVLPRLTMLRVTLDEECAQECAAYICSALPSFDGILSFGYRSKHDRHFIQYRRSI